MIRLAIRAAVFLASAAIGLLVAMAVVDDMTINWSSFVIVVVVFALLQSILTPFITQAAQRNAPALVGGVGLISTLISLLLTALISDGLEIDGAGAWLLAALIVWLVTMVATLLLPIILVKAGISAAAERRQGS
jgi:hypothetical protein